MKKFVVLLVVVAMTCFSATAFAADVTVGGSLDIRSRDFVNTNVLLETQDAATTGDHRDTQSRIRMDINAKAGDVKGKLQLESDFQNNTDFGQGFDTYSSATGTGKNTVFGFREAWVSFNLPFAPVNVTVGHQLLTLGNGWFIRSMHYGSDAWVIANQTGPNTVAFVNAKVAENNVAYEDDIDTYTILDVFKLSDTITIGGDITKVYDRRSASPIWDGTQAELYNLGVNLNAKFGIVGLKAQADMQAGTAKRAFTNPLAAFDPALAAPAYNVDADFKGNQIIVQGNVGLDPVTINFLAGRGTGEKRNETDINEFINFLDVDPHYTFLYEYKTKTAAGRKNSGMANTTIFGVGAAVAATKSVTVAADVYVIKATQAVNINGAEDFLGNDKTSRDVATEVDVKVNWKLYDNLAWNWTLGMMKPGEAYDVMANGVATSADDVVGVQGILMFKF